MARSRFIWLQRVGLAGIALAGAVALGAQQPAPPTQPADQQTPVFRTGINVVRVDVIASDRTGQPVSDLKATDFEVTEDGKPQTVDQFKLIKLDGGVVSTSEGPPRPIRTDEDEEQEAGRADVRLFAIFLDDYHVRKGSSITVREPITKFIQTQLGPSDMVGLMYPLQPVSSVRMTRNHDAVIGGVQQFEGRKYDYRPRNAAEQQYAYYPAETVESIRNQVSLSALEGLIIHMGSLKEGRKALILVSEGFAQSLPPQLRDSIAAVPGSGNPNTLNPLAGTGADLNELRAQGIANSDMQQRLRIIWDTANKYNVAIYAVDPRGLPTSEFDISQPAIAGELDRQYLNQTMDTLRTLSEQTDGKAILNRNDLDVGMRQIIRDSTAYYLLGYNTNEPTDGKFHEIKVRVKRPGVTVRSRKGYWALTAAEVKNALTPKAEQPKAIENALATIAQPSAAHAVVRTWIGTTRGENGKTKVTFVWQAADRSSLPAADRARLEAPSRVLLTVVAPDGSPIFRDRVTDRASFEAPPGKIQIRMSVEGATAQVLDTDTREVTVPDLTAPRAMFGTPEVFRARTARELQQIKADPMAVPMATREFSRTERLLIRVPTYGAGTSTPMLTARLLNRGGNAVTDVPVTPTDAPGVQQVELALSPFAPGEYVLELKAGGDANDAGTTELLAFRITG